MFPMPGGMTFDEIGWLRANSPAWRLLRADSAPLVLSFLHRVFVANNVRSISATELASRLDDELYALNELSPGSFPKPAKAYLDDWARPEAGWLRKYYPDGTDEPHFDATPAVEKALQWVRGLGEREFVGTESRLNTIFDLLRQIVFGTEPDPDARIAELNRQKQEIGEQIDRIEAGDVDILDPSGVRDRYQQFSATARELLADFREVEENFRRLDRRLREKIAGWHGGKGELLDEVLSSRESIAGSDQGRSFQGFYDFLLSQARQEELSDLLAKVHQVTNTAGTASTADTAERDPRLRKVHYDWLDAAERTQATVRQLSEQLRRFLDDQVWLENRRVTEILHDIEARALRLRDAPTPAPAASRRHHDGDRRRHPAGNAADGTTALCPRPQASHRQQRYPPGRERRRNRSDGAIRAGLRGSRPAAQRHPPGPAARLAGRARRHTRRDAAHAGARRACHLPIDEGRGIPGDLRRGAHEQVSWTNPDGQGGPRRCPGSPSPGAVLTTMTEPSPTCPWP